MVCDGVHSDGESQQVASHDEDEENDKGSTDEFSAPFPSYDFCSIGHGRDMRIFPFHLSDHVAGICGQSTKENQDKDRTGSSISFKPCDVNSGGKHTEQFLGLQQQRAAIEHPVILFQRP